jgi:hypothetical protein
MHQMWRSEPEAIGRLLAACAGAGTTVQRLADQLREPLPVILERVARLAKMELVVLAPGETDD